jgi:hypothetical protein
MTTLVDVLEEYMIYNEPLKEHQYLSMKISDIEKGKQTYKKLKENNTIKETYIIFGSNGGGYQCFALYKALNNNIYLFVVKMQDIESYELIENEEWFNDNSII